MLGQLLDGRYKIIQNLGFGGFGQTYLAEDIKVFNSQCVVKKLKPLATDPMTLQVARRLFDQEAKLLHFLGEHDQIPRLLAHFEENQEFFLVQQFIDGHLLSNEFTPGTRLSEMETINLLQNILQPLAFVHQNNIIHRDIKPANLIRRNNDGKIVLIDFGAVKQISTQVVNAQGQTQMTVGIGTVGYMPSEQSRGSPRLSSDVYAVGMIGIQALTGLMPNQLREDMQTAEILWRDLVTVSPAFADVLDNMIRYDFRQRYQSATEALAGIQQLVNSQIFIPPTERSPLPTSPDPTAITERSPLPTPQNPTVISPTQPVLSNNSRSRNLLPVGVGVGVIAAIVGIFFFIPKFSSPPVTSVTVNNSPESNQSKNTEDTDLFNQAKKLHYELNSYPEALAVYDKVIKVQPDNAAAWNERGYVLSSLTRYPEAIASYNKALQLQPNYPEALNGKGYALDNSQKPQEAIASFDKALQLKPDYAEALNNRGNAFINRQKYAPAIADFKQALKIKPKLYQAWNSQAYVLIRLQQYSEAVAAADQALAINQEYAPAWNNKGEALEKLQQYPDALEAYNQALKIQPNFSLAQSNQRRIQNKLNK